MIKVHALQQRTIGAKAAIKTNFRAPDLYIFNLLMVNNLITKVA